MLCAVFSPLLLVGSLVFACRVRFVNMPRGISGRISTAAPAGQQVLDFFEGRGLDVERFEPLGRESGRGTPIGGLVVASR